MANVTAGTEFATAITIANADLTTAIANATNTTCEDSDIGYVTFIDSWYCKLIAGLCTFAAIGKYSPLTKPNKSFFHFRHHVSSNISTCSILYNSKRTILDYSRSIHCSNLFNLQLAEVNISYPSYLPSFHYQL